MDWKSMPEGKEKYQAYLCSREWGLKKEAVRKRCGGICERCCVNAMDHVHHLTYARKYSELLEDLRALCKPCHDFTHGKADHDPCEDRPVMFGGRQIKGVYLAGKITGDDWRKEILEGWNWLEVDAAGGDWGVFPRALTAAYGAKLSYTGPWWCDFDGMWSGHASASSMGFPHACGGDLCVVHGETIDEVDPYSQSTIEKQQAVSDCVANGVAAADLIFAWLNSDDAFGTLFEIGLAVACRKPCVVASPSSFERANTWLARSFCHQVFADTPGQAWKLFWKGVEEAK
jgi:hypothetical protein